MKPTKFESAIALIDKSNSEDIKTYNLFGINYPNELLYSQRMSRRLLQFDPNATEILQIAARAQHICRWKIARNEFSMDKIGYLKWRESLKKMHIELTSKILKTVGYSTEFIDRVSFLIGKKMLKKDTESQTLEDVVCLVFLEYYFEAFSQKHDDKKIIDILKKTWKKMSEKGHVAALKLQFSDYNFQLITQAIGG